MAGSNRVIELNYPIISRRSHHQRVPTRKLSQKCGTKTGPCWPNKSMKPWLMGRLQCTIVHLPRADQRHELHDSRRGISCDRRRRGVPRRGDGWSDPLRRGMGRDLRCRGDGSARGIKWLGRCRPPDGVELDRVGVLGQELCHQTMRVCSAGAPPHHRDQGRRTRPPFALDDEPVAVVLDLAERSLGCGIFTGC